MKVKNSNGSITPSASVDEANESQVIKTASKKELKEILTSIDLEKIADQKYSAILKEQELKLMKSRKKF